MAGSKPQESIQSLDEKSYIIYSNNKLYKFTFSKYGYFKTLQSLQRKKLLCITEYKYTEWYWNETYCLKKLVLCIFKIVIIKCQKES